MLAQTALLLLLTTPAGNADSAGVAIRGFAAHKLFSPLLRDEVNRVLHFSRQLASEAVDERLLKSVRVHETWAPPYSIAASLVRAGARAHAPNLVVIEQESHLGSMRERLTSFLGQDAVLGYWLGPFERRAFLRTEPGSRLDRLAPKRWTRVNDWDGKRRIVLPKWLWDSADQLTQPYVSPPSER
jgi:hypothetical protein